MRVKNTEVVEKMDFIVEKAFENMQNMPEAGVNDMQANIKVIGVGGAGNNMVGFTRKELKEQK